jgi:thymidine kinase
MDFNEIDDMFKGIKPGEFTTIYSSTNSGKSIFEGLTEKKLLDTFHVFKSRHVQPDEAFIVKPMTYERLTRTEIEATLIQEQSETKMRGDNWMMQSVLGEVYSKIMHRQMMAYLHGSPNVVRITQIGDEIQVELAAPEIKQLNELEWYHWVLIGGLALLNFIGILYLGVVR